MNNKDVKPSKNLKMAAGLVASAAAATVAAMAYKVNEEKINSGVDKVADGAKEIIEKTSKKVKEMADDLMATFEEPVACADEVVDVAAEDIVEAEVVEAEVVAEETGSEATEAAESAEPAEEAGMSGSDYAEK